MDFIWFTLGEGRVHSQKPKHTKCKFVEQLIIKPYLHFKVPNAAFKNLHGIKTYPLRKWPIIYLLAPFLFRVSLLGLLENCFLKKRNQTHKTPQPYWLTEIKLLRLLLLAEQVETCIFMESKDKSNMFPVMCSFLYLCSQKSLYYFPDKILGSYHFLKPQLSCFTSIYSAVSVHLYGCAKLHWIAQLQKSLGSVQQLQNSNTSSALRLIF